MSTGRHDASAKASDANYKKEYLNRNQWMLPDHR